MPVDDLVAPVWVLDVTDDFVHEWRGHPDLLAWMDANGIPGHAWRVEHLIVDGPALRIFEPVLDTDGQRLIDEPGTGLIQREPYMVLQRAPLPDWIRARAQ